jgi:hypothetical protein
MAVAPAKAEHRRERSFAGFGLAVRRRVVQSIDGFE